MKTQFGWLLITIILMNVSCFKGNHDAGVSANSKQTDKSRGPLSKEEALARAETFIAHNGYTEAPPKDDGELFRESLEKGASAEEILRYRRNTLLPKGFCVLDGRKGGLLGWTVIFLFNPDNIEHQRMIPDYLQHVKENGRAVTMDRYGRDIRVEHEDYPLSEVERMLHSASGRK